MQHTENILDDLKPGERTVSELPYGGYIFLEHDIPSLLIYRKIPNDKATRRLARSGASYLIIGEENPDFFKSFLLELTKKMAARFGSFLLLEIYSGKAESTEFVIRGPSHKLPVSLNVLKEKLEAIKSRKFGVELSARIEQTKQRQLVGVEALLAIEDMKTIGGTLIGLEVPPVYRDEEGKVYPVYFRQFRNQFASAIQKSVFEFIRVQTSSKLRSYNALGKRNIHKEVFKIDRQLTEIESGYQFLLLLAPVNIQQIRQRFFETNFKEVNEYHYRLLPIDPDLLKRKLYNLRIDEIDDPALAYLFDEKREEIDHQLTMLKERGSKRFLYSSMNLYKGVEKKILSEAKLILENIPEDHEEEKNELLDVEDFKKLAEEEFAFFKEQIPAYEGKVHIRKDVNIMMVSQGELYLPSDYKLTHSGAKALIQHEVGTHALTYFNGQQQPLSQLAIGLADYEALQEGIAVLSEYLIGGLSGNRLRILAGRVVAGDALLDDCNFKSVFNLLYSQYDFTKERAFNITSRMFQGGGFLKDIIYLKGLVQLQKFVMKGGNLEDLLAGKFALKHVPVIKDLTERGLLIPPKLKPRYLSHPDFEEKINKFKQGISLSKMI